MAEKQNNYFNILKKITNSKILVNPVFVFVSIQAIWLAMTIMWVIWFVDESKEIASLARNFGSQYFDDTQSLVMLIVGCILLGMLAVGTIFLFVFGQRQSKLIRQQKNFVSSVTHELRSPLSSLQLTCETMKKHKLDEKLYDKMVNMALTDIERLSKLVNQILVSARLDSGLSGFEEPKEVLKFRNIIEKSLERALWLDKNLYSRISVDCSNELTLKAAPAPISLIISNLIENAIKYSSPEDQIKIRVASKGDFVRFSIQDKGLGLSQKDIKKIFRMFYRSNISITKAVPGTGLGLFIVKSLVQVLGGDCWVESPGRGLGSTFFVTLPIGGQ